jgi:cobalt-zinc-cadmium efflux system protein
MAHGHAHDEPHEHGRHGDHDHGAHGHSHGPGHAHGADKVRVLIAAVLTAGFMVVEAAGGLLTGSLALLADAAHMLTDSVALLLAWYAFHLSARPGSARMTFGFDRWKTLVAYTNALAILAIGLWIVYEAAHRIMTPEPVLAGPMLWVALAGLAVNICAFLVLHGGNRESLNMRGAVLHVLGDLLGSVAAIIAAIVILSTGWTLIDPILSSLVALLLFRSAWSLMRESATLLLEGAPSGMDRDAIARDIETSVPGVREVHHVHLWSLDGERNMVTLHARLDEGTDTHSAVAAIKVRLASQHRIGHATVEPEFDCCADVAGAHGH